MWDGRRGIPLFIGDEPSHWNDATNQMEPHGTSLEERNNIMNEPRDCTTCQHQGQGLKKKNHQIKIKSPQIKATMTDNTRTRGQLMGFEVNPSLDV